MEDEIIDKMAMVALKAKGKHVEVLIPEDEKKTKVLFPKGQGKRTLQTYVKDMAIKARPPDYRNTGRGGKTWAIPPPNYAPIASNQGVGLASKIRDSGWQESTDMAGDVINEILRFGRQTIDEVVGHLGGYDPNLLTIIINALIQDDYLTTVDKDEDGTKNTLELVEENHRNRMLESRTVVRRELEHPEWKENRIFMEALPTMSPENVMGKIPRYIDKESGEIDYDLSMPEAQEGRSEEEELREFASGLEIIRPEDTEGEGEYEVEEYHAVKKKGNSLKIQDTD